MPYLVRLPLPDGAVVLKVRDVWPRTAKVYCHEALGWPEDPDVVDRVPVRLCQRRGAAVDLVLDRAGRTVPSSCSPRPAAATSSSGSRRAPAGRPDRTCPCRPARAAGQLLEILVDSHERYPWTFTHQQASTRRRALPAGDYAVELDGRIVAAVERKSLADLVVDDDRRQAALPARRAAIAAAGGGRRRGPLLGGVQAGARATGHGRRRSGRGGGPLPGRADRVRRDPAAGPGVDLPIPRRRRRPPPRGCRRRTLGAALPLAGEVPPPAPTTAEVRAWARGTGLAVTDRGRLPPEVWAAYAQAHPSVVGDD